MLNGEEDCNRIGIDQKYGSLIAMEMITVYSVWFEISYIACKG
jgi:hypothetical protein